MSSSHLFQKKIFGQKRHLLVDTQGCVLAVKVYAANLLDRVGAPLLLAQLPGHFPRISHLFADKAYASPLTPFCPRRA